MKIVMIESFLAEEEGELGVEKGEVLDVIEPDQDGWTYVQNVFGEAGLVPSDFTAPHEPETQDPTIQKNPEMEPLDMSPLQGNAMVPPPPLEAHPSDTRVYGEGKKIEPPEPRKRTPSFSKMASVAVSLISPRKENSNSAIPISEDSLQISDPSHPPGQSNAVPLSPTMRSPRAALEKQNLIKLTPIIIRVYTNEDIHKEIEEKELAHDHILRTFKSIKATGQTPVRHFIEEVAKKLILPDTRQFHMYIIDRKALTMKLLREDERPVEIHNNSATEVQFALIFAPKVKIKEPKNRALELRWQTKPGDLTHRRLINDTPFLKFSDLTLNLGNNVEISTFKAIVEVRFPSLLEVDESLVKKKREKNMAHGVGAWIRFHDGLFTLDVFQQIFDYMYTGTLEFVHLELEKIIVIFAAAQKLHYNNLLQYLRSHIESSIGMHNVFLVLKFCEEQKLDELKAFAFNFCFNNWQTVSASKEGLTIIGLSLFQEMTMGKAGMQETPPLLDPTPTPENTIVQDFQKIRSLMHFADAVSVFGNLIIPYHRCVLAAASPKFLQMFLKESGSSKKLNQYSFDNVSGGAFKGLIDLIYSGTTNISPNEACELLEYVAVPFDLHSVREDCEALLCREKLINEGNVMNILRISYLKMSEGRAHLTVNARNFCLSYICSHFRDIDISKLKSLDLDVSTAWELLQMLHIRFKKHNIQGLE